MPMLQPPDGEAGAAASGGRRPTVVPAPASPSPELSDRPRRRTFTAQDKLRILAETDRAAATGGIGAILRREGLYSSALTDWRRQRDAGAFMALVPGKRGPKTTDPSPFSAEVTQLQHDNARLTRRLTRAEAIIDIQKNELGSAARLCGRNWSRYRGHGGSGRKLFGGSDPVKKRGPWAVADLRVVTPPGDPV